MARARIALLTALAACAAATPLLSAGTGVNPIPASFTGNFSADSDQREFFFSLSSPGTVTLRTFSYGGGTNAAGAAVPAGGFDPTLTLYDSAGVTIALNQDAGCSQVAQDPTTALCLDAYISATLPAGNYRVVLTQSVNLPAGPTLADSFLFNPANLFNNTDLNGSVPVPPFGGQTSFTTPTGETGSYWDLSNNERNSFFAVDVLGASAVTSPGITSPQTLPSGTTGITYSPVTLTLQSGPGISYTWSASANSLPPGLLLSSSGVLSGTPTTAGTYTFAVTATDGVQPVSQTETVVVGTQAGPPVNPLTITQSVFAVDVAVGGSVNVSFGASGGSSPYSFTASGVPAGLSFSGSSLTGTASQAGDFTVSVRVTDARQNSAFTTLPVNVLGLTSSTLQSGVAGQFYSAGIPAIGGNGPYSFTPSGLPSGLSLSSSGNITGTVKTPGTYNFSVTVTDAGSASASASFSVSFAPAQPLTISNAQLPSGVLNAPYSQSLNAVGGFQPYSWSVNSGSTPAGLTLSSTGTVSGTPTASGQFSFAVRVTDSAGGSATATALITIQGAPLIISPSSLPTGVSGTPYPQIVLTASGAAGPFTYTITQGGLPAGLSLSGDGSITGTPTATGDSSFTISATNGTGSSGTASFTVTIRNPAAADLILSAGALNFTIQAPASAPPPPESFSVQSTQSTQPLKYALTVSPAVSWLTVANGSSTPDAVQASINQSALALAAGDYSTGLTLTCTSTVCNGHTQLVSVTLHIASTRPQLQVTDTQLSFGSNVASTLPMTQSISVANSGGGTLNITGISCEAAWCTVGSAPASLAGGVSASIPVTVNPGLLQAGFYRTQVDITTSAGTSSVAVTAFITAASSMTLAPVGTQFGMLAGGTPGNSAGSFLVSVSTSTAVNFSASVTTNSPWLTVTSGTGSSTVSQPQPVSFSINSQAAKLAAGTYYALITVSSTGVVNSPQSFEVVLNVSPAITPVIPDPEPGGLLFITSAGGAPPPQTVTVFSASTVPSGYQASVVTADGGSWLSVSPTTGNSSTGSPGVTTVSVNPTVLKPGVYTGGVSYALSATAVRVVNVTAIVTSPVTATAGGAITTSSLRKPEQIASGCAPKLLAPTQTGLVNNFASPVAWPTPLSIVLANDCGAFVTNAQMVATFSNGDPPLALTLADPNRGFYSGTWTSRKAASQVTIVAHVSAPGYPEATTQIVGTTVPNSAPVLTPHGTLHSFYPLVGAALAPGTIIQIYGQNLAASTTQPTTIPLPTSVNGTSVIIGGVPAPLYYVSGGQINAQIPFELDASKQYQILVSANSALTTPDTIQLQNVSPGVAAFADGTLIAQHAADYSLVTAENPARSGEYLIVYLAGLGVTNATPASGAASPSSPLARPLDQPTLTINGAPSPIAFAGLTPGDVGLYQINFQVPAGLPAGSISVVVSQDSQSSNQTALPYRP